MTSPYCIIFKHSKKTPNTLREQLMKCNTLTNLTDMVQELTRLLQLTEEEYKERVAMYSRIHDKLKKYYPDCFLAMIGPAMNGFGSKNCNLDLLFLPHDFYSCTSDKKRNQMIQPPPDPESILSGRIPFEVLYNLDEWSNTLFLKKAFKKEKPMIKNAFIMPGKEPALRLNLNGMNWNCDVHLANKDVVCVSELLQFLEKVDPRVKPLALTLSFWSHSIGFAKQSIYSNYFSDYVFTLLAIFYLQNTDPPILPPVEYLIAHAGPEAAFSTDMSLIKKSNTQTLGELLINFYEFYWNFDFVQNIVSVNSGKILPIKAVFEQPKLKGFEICQMNIQDPFVLSHNVCKYDEGTPKLDKLQSEAPMVLFKLALSTAHQILKNIPLKYKFNMLFDSNKYQQILDIAYASYMDGNPKPCFIDLNYGCMSYISRNSEFSLHLWYEKVAQVVYEVLQNGLLMECEITNNINWSTSVTSIKGDDLKKEIKDESSSSEENPFDLSLIQSLQCVAYARTWAARKKPRLESTSGSAANEDFNTSVLNAECKVSKEMFQNKQSCSTPVMRFKCDLYKHNCPQMNNVIVLFKPSTFSKDFDKFYAFISSYLPNTVKKILSN